MRNMFGTRGRMVCRYFSANLSYLHNLVIRLWNIGALHAAHPDLTPIVLQALSLCKGILSFTWADDSFGAPTQVQPSLFYSDLSTYSPLGGASSWLSGTSLSDPHHSPAWPSIPSTSNTGAAAQFGVYGETLFSVLLRAILGRLPVQSQHQQGRDDLRCLTLKTYADLGSDTWTMLEGIGGLKKVAVWSMDGPPRVLERWCTTLAPTLTQVELGVST